MIYHSAVDPSITLFTSDIARGPYSPRVIFLIYNVIQFENISTICV